MTAAETPVGWPEYRAAVRDRIAALADADAAHWRGAEAAGVTRYAAARPAGTASDGTAPGRRQVLCSPLCIPMCPIPASRTRNTLPEGSMLLTSWPSEL